MHAEMTDRARRALAELVSEIRASAKLPAWDVPGIAAAISRARGRGSADEVAIALLRLASRADLRNPAVLADEGAHWRDLEGHARVVRPSDHPRCTERGHEYEALSATGECRLCRAESLPGDHPANPVPEPSEEQRAAVTRGADTVRAAMREHGIPERGTA